MAESPTQEQINQATRQNSDLAARVAYAEEPFRVGIDRALEIGEVATAEVLQALQFSVAQKEFEQDVQLEGKTSKTLGQYPPSLTPETEQSELDEVEKSPISPERLRDIMNTSIYVAGPYVKGGENVIFNGVDGSTQGSFLESMKGRRPTQGIEWPFLAAGASELVTIAKAADFDTLDPSVRKSAWPSGKHLGEPIYMLQYATLTNDPMPDPNKAGGVIYEQKYEYKENRFGHLRTMSDQQLSQMSDEQREMRERMLQQPTRWSEFHYTMLLPESLAHELGNAMRAQPQLARELGDLLVYNPNGERQTTSRIAELWGTWKPPYETWREVNGGVNRIAFRTAPNQSVAQATLVEF